MKTRFLLLFLSFFSISTYGAVISVVNGDNLQTKITNAVAGDVLIVGPGTYNPIVVNKKLTILGPGYFKNSGGNAVISGNIDISSTGAGSYVSGLYCTSVTISASDVTFVRNLVTYQMHVGYGISTSNVKVIQNYLCANNLTSNDNNLLIIGTGNLQTNYLIQNNIVMTKINFNHPNGSTGLVINNTFDPDSSNSVSSSFWNDVYRVSGGDINGVSFYNNIFKGKFPFSTQGMFTSAANTPLNFKWNIVDVITDSITLPSDNLISTAKIFGGYPTNTIGLNNADGRAILAPGSPAANYGRKAPYASNSPVTDAGAFGGDQPYVLSGIPVGPQIYSMSVPPLAAANSVIPVTVKAKTNN
ncbi:MAG: hypothetical protein LCH67_18765 [Bacteroidetes bacterium]|nr:hypothetical protein [Bacteroidota bacterium]